MSHDAVCLGILVADVIARPVSELPERGTLGLLDEISLRGGGCALNTASALRRFGLDVAVAGRVGDDPFGEFLLAVLDERGIDRASVVRDSAVPTSATVVLVAPDGEQTFLHRLGASGALQAEQFAREEVLAARALHIAGALVMPAFDGPSTAALLQEARRRGVLTSLDTAFDARGRWRRIDDVLPHIDLFTANVAEARAITGESDPRRMAAWLRRAGAREVAVKLGREGCYAAGDGFEAHVGAASVVAVDGTGAGDAFAAGLLYGRLAGWPFEHAARFANAAGALATTTVGASDGIHGLDETLALADLEAEHVA